MKSQLVPRVSVLHTWEAARHSLHICNLVTFYIWKTSPITWNMPNNYFPSYFFHGVPTSLMWVGSRENSQEATPSGVGIRYHLQEHLVAHRNQGSWLECPTEATKSLPIDMAAVDIHIVIAAQVVVLQVNKAERQDHNLSLGHLGGNLQWVPLSHNSCNYKKIK